MVSLAAGSKLPDGLAIHAGDGNASGLLYGTPRRTGDFTFVAREASADGRIQDVTFSLHVGGVPIDTISTDFTTSNSDITITTGPEFAVQDASPYIGKAGLVLISGAALVGKGPPGGRVEIQFSKPVRAVTAAAAKVCDCDPYTNAAPDPGKLTWGNVGGEGGQYTGDTFRSWFFDTPGSPADPTATSKQYHGSSGWGEALLHFPVEGFPDARLATDGRRVSRLWLECLGAQTLNSSFPEHNDVCVIDNIVADASGPFTYDCDHVDAVTFINAPAVGVAGDAMQVNWLAPFGYHTRSPQYRLTVLRPDGSTLLDRTTSVTSGSVPLPLSVTDTVLTIIVGVYQQCDAYYDTDQVPDYSWALSRNDFTVSVRGNDEPLQVTGISPITAFPGETITIAGSGFQASGGSGGAILSTGMAVFIGGIPAANVVVRNSRTITATVPQLPLGRADVVVRTADGRSASLPADAGTFTITPPSPRRRAARH